MRVAVLFGVVVVGCGFTVTAQLPGDDAIPRDAAPHDAKPNALLIDAAIDAPPDPALPCPNGYALLPARPTSSSRYRFPSLALGWDVAEADCADDADAGERATHLVVLDDDAERVALQMGPTGSSSLADLWIGATDRANEAAFEPITPQQTTLSLASTTGNAVDKDCIRMRLNGTGDARSCLETNGYACECDGIAADPARFPNAPDGDN